KALNPSERLDSNPLRRSVPSSRSLLDPSAIRRTRKGRRSRSSGATTAPIRIGVVSDTHALLRKEALARLSGVAHIVHACDVGSPDILAALGQLAPLTAVRGNNDEDPWARELPETALLEVGGVSLYIIHDVHELDLDPRALGIAAVISGHSHKPRM